MGLIGQIRQRVGLLVGSIAVAMVVFLLMDALDSQTGFLGAQGITGMGLVNGEEINPQAYEAKIDQIIKNYESNGMDVTEEMRLQARQQAWTQLTNDMLTEKEYDKLGIQVTNAEMEQLLLTGGENLHQSIKNAPIFQSDSGGFDQNKLKQYVQMFAKDDQQARDAKAQWKRFEDGVYEETLKSKYTNLIKKAMYVPAWYAKMDNADKNAKSNGSYVMIPYTSINDADVKISDSDLLSYLNKHKNEFKQKDTRAIEFASFPVVPTQQDSAAALNIVATKTKELETAENVERFIKVADSETPFTGDYLTKAELASISPTMKDTLFKVALGTVMGPYYESGSYKSFRIIDRKTVADSADVRLIFKQFDQANNEDKVKKSIDSLRGAIAKVGFATVADSTVSNPSMKGKGGSIGYIKRGNTQQVPKELHDAVFYEHKSGETFEVKTGNGIFLIKIDNTGGSNEAAKVAFMTRAVEPSESTINAIYAKAQQFAGANRTIEAFKKGAAEQGIKTGTSNDLSTSDFRVGDLGVAEDMVQWAFQNKTGTVSDRVFNVESKLPDGRIKTDYVVAAVASAKKEGIATLEDVRTKIEGEVKKQKKAEQIIAKLGTPTDLAQVASSNGQEVKVIADATFASPAVGDMGREPKVQAALFGLKPNQISKPVAGERGVYVVQLTAITPAPEPDLATAKNEILQGLQSRADFGAAQALSKMAEIKDNRMKVVK